MSLETMLLVCKDSDDPTLRQRYAGHLKELIDRTILYIKTFEKEKAKDWQEEKEIKQWEKMILGQKEILKRLKNKLTNYDVYQQIAPCSICGETSCICDEVNNYARSNF